MNIDSIKDILYEVLLESAERAAPRLITRNGKIPLPDPDEVWSPLLRLMAGK